MSNIQDKTSFLSAHHNAYKVYTLDVNPDLFSFLSKANNHQVKELSFDKNQKASLIQNIRLINDKIHICIDVAKEFVNGNAFTFDINKMLKNNNLDIFTRLILELYQDLDKLNNNNNIDTKIINDKIDKLVNHIQRQANFFSNLESDFSSIFKDMDFTHTKAMLNELKNDKVLNNFENELNTIKQQVKNSYDNYIAKNLIMFGANAFFTTHAPIIAYAMLRISAKKIVQFLVVALLGSSISIPIYIILALVDILFEFIKLIMNNTIKKSKAEVYKAYKILIKIMSMIDYKLAMILQLHKTPCSHLIAYKHGFALLPNYIYQNTLIDSNKDISFGCIVEYNNSTNDLDEFIKSQLKDFDINDLIVRDDKAFLFYNYSNNDFIFDKINETIKTKSFVCINTQKHNTASPAINGSMQFSIFNPKPLDKNHCNHLINSSYFQHIKNISINTTNFLFVKTKRFSSLLAMDLFLNTDTISRQTLIVSNAIKKNEHEYKIYTHIRNKFKNNHNVLFLTPIVQISKYNLLNKFKNKIDRYCKELLQNLNQSIEGAFVSLFACISPPPIIRKISHIQNRIFNYQINDKISLGGAIMLYNIACNEILKGDILNDTRLNNSNKQYLDKIILTINDFGKILNYFKDLTLDDKIFNDLKNKKEDIENIIKKVYDSKDLEYLKSYQLSIVNLYFLPNKDSKEKLLQDMQNNQNSNNISDEYFSDIEAVVLKMLIIDQAVLLDVFTPSEYYDFILYIFNLMCDKKMTINWWKTFDKTYEELTNRIKKLYELDKDMNYDFLKEIIGKNSLSKNQQNAAKLVHEVLVALGEFMLDKCYPDGNDTLQAQIDIASIIFSASKQSLPQYARWGDEEAFFYIPLEIAQTIFVADFKAVLIDSAPLDSLLCFDGYSVGALIENEKEASEIFQKSVFNFLGFQENPEKIFNKNNGAYYKIAYKRLKAYKENTEFKEDVKHRLYTNTSQNDDEISPKIFEKSYELLKSTKQNITINTHIKKDIKQDYIKDNMQDESVTPNRDFLIQLKRIAEYNYGLFKGSYYIDSKLLATESPSDNNNKLIGNLIYHEDFFKSTIDRPLQQKLKESGE